MNAQLFRPLHHLSLCALSLTLFIGLPARAAEPAKADSLTRVLPSGALGFVEVDNLAGQIQRLRQSLLVKLVLESPEYGEAIKAPQYKQGMAFIKVAENILDMDVWKFADTLLGGQLSIALYPKADSKQPEPLVILRTADAAGLEKMRLRLAPLVALAGEKIQRKEEAGGMETFQLDDKLFVALHKNWIVASPNRDLALRAVALLGGEKGASLADDAPVAKLREQMGANHFVQVGVNLEALRKSINARMNVPAQFDNGAASLLFQAVAELAVRSPYFGATLDVDDKGFTFVTGLAGGPKTLAPEHQWYFSDPKTGGTPPLPAVPGLIGGFSTYGDFSQWYRNREKLLVERVQPEFDKFESGIKTLLPGRDFADDVLPALGRTITFVAAHQTYTHLGGGEPAMKLPGFALVFDLAKPQEGGDLFQLLFQTIATLTNFGAAESGNQPWVMMAENYKDVSISLMRHLKKPEGKLLPPVYNFMPCAARVGNRFVLTSSPSLCRQLVDAFQKPPAAATANKNLNIELFPIELAALAQNNLDLLTAQAVQGGKDADQAKRGIEALLKVLRTIESAKLFSTVKEDRFQFRLEGHWK